MAWFDGKEAKVERSAGTIDVYYGGSFTPDGPGHGHVKATGGPLGENIVYWRLPDSEGGQVIDRQQLLGHPVWQRPQRTSDWLLAESKTWTSL